MPVYCFICSAARSGSTLLDRILGAHSKAASLGEISFLNKAISLNQMCSCGNKISDCDTWNAVLKRIENERHIDLRHDPYAMQFWDARASVIIDKKFQTPFFLLTSKLRTLQCDLRYKLKVGNKLRLPLPRKLVQDTENSLYLYQLLTSIWQKELLIDSSKNVHKAIAVHEKSAEHARIIYLTRDGRGVYNSRRSSGFSRHESASAWYKYNKRASTYLAANIPAEHLFRVKYEELVNHPAETLSSICKFLGIAFEENMLNFTNAEHHLVNGNDMRFKQSHKLILDERWLTELGTKELATFERLTGSMNSTLGYH